MTVASSIKLDPS